MLNFFKKSDGSRHTVGGGKGSGFEPPKNLPDLAGDIYENGHSGSTANSVANAEDSLQQHPQDTHDIHIVPLKPVIEPSKDFVHTLDLSLIRQQPVQQPIQQPIQQSPSYDASQQTLSNVVSLPQENLGMIDDATGFFKEFENYIRDNGLNNDIIDELLDKNLLDHMVFYHTTKGGDMPFYASSAELSHAIKLKLENLQNLERTWIANKQKMDILKKLGINIEEDIHIISEELKKFINEFRRRGVSVKPSDFFQIVKPRVDEKNSVRVDKKDNVYEKGHVEALSKTFEVQNPLSEAARHAPIRMPMLQYSNASKYVLNKYSINDTSKYFYAKNGQVFKSLSDLMDGLELMDLETFNHHVTDSKNDFSNWIKGVFGDFRLSDAVRPLNNREKLWYYLRNNTL
jgi:hypothetical protein